ncbi:hypothetical protein K7432_006615 [Basidiobolus ranarum]|uniref:Inositol polyphosphate-related phosphatase domain-containing protein n=1 Tax=Basidiobolus ranarum TaxID=34480 RepID=A0ABR2W1D8_9FUNG
MTIESKWTGKPEDARPLSSVPSTISPNENILASSLPSVKSQIQQWSKMNIVSDKPNPSADSSTTTAISKPTNVPKPPSEFTKILPSSLTSTKEQKSWVKFGENPSVNDPTFKNPPFPGKTFEKASNTIASFNSNAEPVVSTQSPSKHPIVVPNITRSIPIPIKAQNNPPVNVKQDNSLEENTEQEEGRRIPGRISSPFIDADSVQVAGTPSPSTTAPAIIKKTFPDSMPIGKIGNPTNHIASRVAQPNLTQSQNVITQNRELQETTPVADPFSDDQAFTDTSTQRLGMASRMDISPPEASIQVPPRPSSKIRPIPIHSKNAHPSLIPRSTSGDQETPQLARGPTQLDNRPVVPHRSVPDENILNSIENSGVKVPFRPAHTLPAHPESYIEELRIKDPPYTNTTQSNANFSIESDSKPAVPYRPNNILPRRPAPSDEGNDPKFKPLLPARSTTVSQQDYIAKDPYKSDDTDHYAHRSKSISGKNVPRSSAPVEIQRKGTLSARTVPSPPAPSNINSRDLDIANRAPVVPRKNVPVPSMPQGEYDQRPVPPQRPIPGSHPPKPNLANRPNIPKMNILVSPEYKPDPVASETLSPQSMGSTGVMPPVLPPKPVLPQKWANSNLGQYTASDMSPPSDPPEFAPPSRTNTTDSDSNSDDANYDPSYSLQQPLFPDQTYTNRRAPELSENSKNHMVRLQHKNAPKRFSIAGHVVITGHVAIKMWSVKHQEAHTICHEDGKVSAITPCPSPVVDEEGRRFWCGLLDGTLIEIDTETRKVTNRISSAHNAPVTHILRYKFQLWTMDDNGIVKMWTPDGNKLSFFRKPITIQIAKRQQVAMIVRNQLWTAREKNLYIYEYVENTKSLQQVVSLDIGPDVGNITCLTKNREGTLVYTGHMDGKVMIWDTMSHDCVRVVPVSNYRICSLLCVREKYLWTGFATGRIYIYDISYDHWIVVKSWDAHRSSPVNQIKLNTSSIFLAGEVQIASFAEDGGVKIWDGMLTSDWKEKEMLMRDTEFCQFRDIKVLICSWNIDARKPEDRGKYDTHTLETWLSTTQDPEVIVVGFQETVDLESKKVTAKSILKFKNKKNNGEEQWTHRYKLWQDRLTEAVEKAGHKSKYKLIQCQNLIGLFTCIFVKASEENKIKCVTAGKVKTGFGGLHGNKGGIAVRFLYEDSSLCFINCHLAAGQGHVLQRNNDAATILQTSIFEPINGYKFVFVKGGNGTLITDHGLCFWSGDLNYRIDLPRTTVEELIKEEKWDALYENDQLHREQSENLAFMLRSFTEGPIKFAPTYKYDPYTENYDTSEKQRIPAWCDRILYRGERIQQHSYQRHEMTNSDHRPISAVFTATIKTVLGMNHVQRVQNEVEAAWANHMEKILHRGIEDWLVACGYPRETVKQVLERDRDIYRASSFLRSQFPWPDSDPQY